jgi:hypothetical protein
MSRDSKDLKQSSTNRLLMKKTKMALALIFLTLAALTTIAASTYFFVPVNNVAFLTMADGVNPCLVITSPSGSGTFQTSSVDISLDYYVPKNAIQVNSFSYSLNEDSNSTLRCISRQTFYSGYAFSYPYIDYSIFKTLKNLANNDYNITVYAHFVNGTVKSI